MRLKYEHCLYLKRLFKLLIVTRTILHIYTLHIASVLIQHSKVLNK